MIREMHNLFTIARMQHLDSNIPSNISCASICSQILRFARTSSNINTFVTLPNCFKENTKQGSKHRSIIYMLNKILDKNFTVFNVKQQ